MDKNENNHILNNAALCQNDALSCAETFKNDLRFCNRIGRILPPQGSATFFLSAFCDTFCYTLIDFLFALCDSLSYTLIGLVGVHLKMLGLSHLVSKRDLDSPLCFGNTSLKLD